MPRNSDKWIDSIDEDAPSDEHTVRALYDEFAAHYDQTLDKWRYRAPDVVARHLLDHVPTDQPVLDAGCGTGLTGAALTRAGFTRITGADLSPVSVTKAKETGHYEQVLELNLSAPLPFDDGQFSGAVCVGVFSYIPDLEPVLRELLRVVTPGGALVFTQRDDLYLKRGNATLFELLESEGLFRTAAASEPLPYLPGNPNFSDTIGVRYFVWRTPKD